MSGLNGKINTEPSYLHKVPLGNNQESRNKRILAGIRISSNVGITNDKIQNAIARSKGSSGANSSTAAAKGGKRTRKYRKKMNKRKTRSYRK
jgi:hypothetical protein